ncbi:MULTISPECIES: GMC family oxidoreductase [Streptomyces]|uniref:Glucose-methanol-choline oxidoreductase n=1 Tax=Streptomyces diastatochromogenes TaxID=42236 RepID=A0A233SCE9_STRDA|nr:MULTISPECIES: GMC family oxidoreductase N-terminal domain-containing protein [Streptomyces]MCZ0988362.1 GMC family oxidoreductase N-terminal domain-containing protein [Streptomyces diastatochromogenes]OXY93336.1 glucose-methanol-choline oxidoreductase [Streptomyces diastatochromogenes]SOD85454.1 choline dehydrogenase [Streptomyces sp. Ag109_G2-15]
MTETYDFVVVGGGTAGLVTATRLSELEDVSVLVIEAGSAKDDRLLEVPELWSQTNLSEFDWSYLTEPQPALGGETVYSAAGRGVGGSSNIYHMIHNRGPDADYDTWAYQGAAGWSAKDVLPYFQRIENQEDGTNPTAGQGGPINVVNTGDEGNPVSQAFVDGCVELGYPEVADVNVDRFGVGWHHLDLRDGKRNGVRTAYYDPARARTNLTVRADSTATRLLFEGTRCVGVEYLHEGERKTVRAEREVVVSSGAIESPKLLLLSGIGDPKQLTSFGIDVVADLPGVGENYQNHPLVIGPTGYMDKPGPAEGVINEPALYWGSQPGLPAPDMELWFLPRAPWGEKLIEKLMEWKRTGSTSSVSVQDEVDPRLVIMLPAVIRPLSRGWIRLASADPTVRPRVNPNFYGERADLERATDITEIAREVFRSKAFTSQWGVREVAPGPDVQTRAELRDWVAHNTGSFHHYSGTCKMGIDELSVVDARLRVRGIEGLRVADASVMPSIVSAHTHTTAVMIGERAADFIKEDLAARG